MSIDPLSRYPAIHTADVQEFEYRLRSTYGATGFTLADPSALKVRANFLPLQDIALGFSGLGTEATVHFDGCDFAVLQLPLRGKCVVTSGRRPITVSAGCPCITSAGQPIILERGVDFEQLFLRANSSELCRKLELLLDTPVHGEIEFEPAEFASPSRLLGLRRLIDLVVTQLDDEEALLPPPALRELEQAIIVQLLLASRHNYSDALDGGPRDPAPAHLRRVEAYIEANWNRPILIEDLVAVAGVSARSLYSGFEKVFECSPMAFVKRQRLLRARERLTITNEATTVTGVAFACGFSNLGHFARDYRATFGELPSETLRKSRTTS